MKSTLSRCAAAVAEHRLRHGTTATASMPTSNVHN
jgi:hypothetical protein